jgi:hypothetical protein
MRKTTKKKKEELRELEKVNKEGTERRKKNNE